MYLFRANGFWDINIYLLGSFCKKLRIVDNVTTWN